MSSPDRIYDGTKFEALSMIVSLIMCNKSSNVILLHRFGVRLNTLIYNKERDFTIVDPLFRLLLCSTLFLGSSGQLLVKCCDLLDNKFLWKHLKAI